MQNTMGKAGYGMFFMFASFDVLMGIYVYFIVPETKGLSLEKMDELFGVTEMIKRVDDENEGELGRPTSIREEHADIKK
jgi:hypothetical protein